MTDAKSSTMKLRLSPLEKTAFQECAEIAGISLSAWIRERLRHAAIRDLERAGRPVPFVKPLRLEVPSVRS